MALPNDDLRRTVDDTRRMRSPAGWIAGAVFVAALLGIWLFYNGTPDASMSSGANPPNVVSNSAPSDGAKK